MHPSDSISMHLVLHSTTHLAYQGEQTTTSESQSTFMSTSEVTKHPDGTPTQSKKDTDTGGSK